MLYFLFTYYKGNLKYEVRNSKHEKRNSKYEIRSTKHEARNSKYEVRNGYFIGLLSGFLLLWKQDKILTVLVFSFTVKYKL